MSPKGHAPLLSIKRSNRRATWVCWKLLEWAYGRPFVPAKEVRDFLATLPHIMSESDSDLIIRHLCRVGALEISGMSRNSGYYVSDWGRFLLDGYKKRNPAEPTSDDDAEEMGD